MSSPSILRHVASVLEMIKFQHSVFALPFALAAMIVAEKGWPSAWTLCWIVAACVFARSAAMAFNRLADVAFDAENPRTQMRALVTGAVTRRFTVVFIVASVAGFLLSAGMLNPLCLALSPLALVVLLGYSYVKRFSNLTHFVLGVALAIAPVGAWLAVTGDLSGLAAPITLGAAVALWTAGFDIIYACQDIEFDHAAGLRSLPSRLGARRALWVSTGAHVLTGALLFAFWALAGLGWGTFVASLAISLLLIVEHLIVSPRDLSRVDAAFFTINGVVSFVFLGGVAVDVLVLA